MTEEASVGSVDPAVEAAAVEAAAAAAAAVAEEAGVPPPAVEAEEAEEGASRFDEKVGRNSTGGWRIAGERSRASPALISLPN